MTGGDGSASPLSRSPQGTRTHHKGLSPLTCPAAFVDESAQGLAHSGAEVWALADGHAQGAGQTLEGLQHIHGVGAEAGQQGPDLEGKGKGGRVAPFAQVTHPQLGTMGAPQQGSWVLLVTCHCSVS